MKITGMLKLGIILAAFAATACVMLAFVYAGTQKVIAVREEADLQTALKNFFENADNFEPVEGIKSPNASVTINRFFKVNSNGAPVGAAVEVTRAGYAGPVTLMIGVGLDGKITGVKILEHSETPGLGANAASSKYFVDRAKGITFYGQFTGKSVSDPFQVGGDIAAITASTITSRAVADAVRTGSLAIAAWFAGEEADAFSSASAGGAQ